MEFWRASSPQVASPGKGRRNREQWSMSRVPGQQRSACWDSALLPPRLLGLDTPLAQRSPPRPFHCAATAESASPTALGFLVPSTPRSVVTISAADGARRTHTLLLNTFTRPGAVFSTGGQPVRQTTIVAEDRAYLTIS
jgi:hypothetical protein